MITFIISSYNITYIICRFIIRKREAKCKTVLIINTFVGYLRNIGIENNNIADAVFQTFTGH